MTVVVVSSKSVESVCHVKIYEYDPIKDEWIIRGPCLDDTEKNGLESFVKLSSTGSVVAVGTSKTGFSGIKFAGQVEVFEYNKFTDQWKQRGQSIDG